MAVSTTFGYHAGEDRLWIDCAAWPQRLWVTRRLARGMVQALVAALESAAAPAPDEARLADADLGVDATAERAAAAHDASLNQPQPGEQARPLQMGREAADAPALQTAVLCTQFALELAGTQAELVFATSAGQRRLRLSRTGLHRWLHALHMVLRGTDWADWPTPPEWLTRSYLPPALKSLLQMPPADAGLEPPHAGDPPPAD